MEKVLEKNRNLSRVAGVWLLAALSLFVPNLYGGEGLVATLNTPGFSHLNTYRVVAESGYGQPQGFRVLTREGEELFSRIREGTRYELLAAEESPGGEALSLVGSVETEGKTQGYWVYYPSGGEPEECLIPSPVVAISAVERTSRGFLLAGVGRGSYGETPLFLIRTREQCRDLAVTPIPTRTARVTVSALKSTPEGLVLMGTGWNEARLNRDLWMMAVDQKGNPLWEILYGGEEEEQFFDDALRGGELLLMAGTTSAGRDLDLLLIRLDCHSGIVRSSRVLVAPLDQIPLSLRQDGDGHWLVSGMTLSSQGKGEEFYLVVSDTLELLLAQGIPSFPETPPLPQTKKPLLLTRSE